ncbi:hypothetical protein [Halorarum halobium]|uniref:hypothetical protein n=1 Tax=Halorarum halobium TaxID=3075121 RepID=UPI0028B1896E|nr:hypothetical protein [Halobaculum sp. XH14]
MEVYVDATTVISLGNVGRLDLLDAFDGRVLIPDEVAAEVTTEPAHSNLWQFLDGTVPDDDGACVTDAVETSRVEARSLLNEDEVTGDVVLVGAVIRLQRADEDVAVVSDDRRVRRIAEGLCADVTGTVGVLVRAVSEDRLDGTDGVRLVERLDERGLHMTAELRARAEELVRNAADRSP